MKILHTLPLEDNTSLRISIKRLKVPPYIDLTVVFLENRKFFFNPILYSKAATSPALVLAPLLRDTVLSSQPTDLQTAGKPINKTF